MPGFCANIVVTISSGVELVDYVVDGGDLWEPDWREKAKWGIWSQDGGNQTLKTPWNGSMRDTESKLLKNQVDFVNFSQVKPTFVWYPTLT